MDDYAVSSDRSAAVQMRLAGPRPAREQKLAALRHPAPGTSTVITNKMLARLERPVQAARAGA